MTERAKTWGLKQQETLFSRRATIHKVKKTIFGAETNCVHSIDQSGVGWQQAFERIMNILNYCSAHYIHVAKGKS